MVESAGSNGQEGVEVNSLGVVAAAGEGDAGRLAVSVVAPVYNEADNLPELIRRVTDAVAPLGSYEVILVDDGSKDDSWRIISEAAKADEHVVGVRFQRNFGQHPAVAAGFAQARGRVVVTLDADLQNPPEEIPKLVARLGADCDVATGWRQARKDPWQRRLPSLLVNRTLGRMTGVRLHDYGCMLRAYKRQVVEQLVACPELNRSTTALTSWLGAAIVEVPVEHAARGSGRSRYHFWRLLKMNFDLITGFSTGMLQVVSLTGIAVSVVGFAAAVVLAVWRVTHGSGPVGLTTFIAILMFLAGMQVAAIGVVGEYVGRIFVQVQGRPRYVVRETTGERDAAGGS
jgi:undecaprenyl-phosphate 4-deoxy-4-formamido-L-arabinose transferase